MSIHRIASKKTNKVTWRVIWRDAQGNRYSKNFPLKKGEGMAEEWDSRVKTLKATGELHLLFGGMGAKTSLAEYGKRYVANMQLTGQIDRVTLNTYRTLWNAYVLDDVIGIAHYTLRELEVNRFLLREFRDNLMKKGVPFFSRKRTFTLLSAVMREATEDHYIKDNPVHGIKVQPTKAEEATAKKAKDERRAFSPLQIEQLRAQMMKRTNQRAAILPLRDAVLVGLCGYEGLRPGEALYLRWGHLGKKLTIEGAVSLGEENIGGKNSLSRKLAIQDATCEDLEAYRVACGNPKDDQLMFPGDDEGSYWTDDAYRYWRRATFKRAVTDLAKSNKWWKRFSGAVPYDLRRSAASLKIRAGEPQTDIAKDMGHGVETMYRHYASAIEDMEGEKPVPVAKAIAAARKKVWGAGTGPKSLPQLPENPAA